MTVRVDTILIKVQYLLLTGIVMTQALGRDALSSLLFTLTFVLTLGLWLVTAQRRVSGRTVLAMLLVITSGISVLGNALLTSTALSFDYGKKLMMFWSAVLFLGAMGECRPEKSAVTFIFRLNTFLVLFLAGMYGRYTAQMHLLNGQVTSYLTFRFTNPNLAAAFLASIGMLETVQSFTARKCLGTWGHGLLAAGMGWFVLRTQSRNVQLVLALFWVAAVFFALFPKIRPQLGRGAAAMVALFPLLFAAGYLLGVYSPGIQRLFAFLTGKGKPLDSRVWIWRQALREFAASPLLGAYSQISGGTGWSQMHNSHLDVLASYGAVVLFLLWVFLSSLLWVPEKQGQVAFLCRWSFLALLLSGMGEAMLFSGGLGIYLFAGLFRMLANFGFESGGG